MVRISCVMSTFQVYRISSSVSNAARISIRHVGLEWLTCTDVLQVRRLNSVVPLSLVQWLYQWWPAFFGYLEFVL